MSERRYSPLYQLTLSRFREFYREPAAVFWVYVFPLLLAVALGIAFRERPPQKVNVDLIETPANTAAVKQLREVLKDNPGIELHSVTPEEWGERLRRGKTDLIIEITPGASGKPGYQFWLDPNREEGVIARAIVESALLRHAAGDNVPEMTDRKSEERGIRYIDFLIPGLIGLNLMGGGLFGVGFVIVDMRVRKLLKRFLATPMRRRDFMLGVMLSRLVFTIPEVLLLLLLGYWIFGVGNRGTVVDLLVVIFLGGATFAGLGLLVACRAKTIETASGLMNLVMLPMYVVSGVFFAADRFPAEAQPFIQSLPLTALNDALRGVMLEGKSLLGVGSELAIMAAWGLLSFAIALRFFRWR